MKTIIMFSLFCFLPLRLFALEKTESLYLSTARSQKTNRIIYYALHEERYKNGRPVFFTTTYLSPSKKIFATSTNQFNQFNQFTFTPTYKLKDSRFGYKVSVKPLSSVRFRLTKRLSWNEPTKKAALTIYEHPIINNAGFFPFISQHWQQLTRKHSLSFIYVLADHLNYYPLLLIKTKQTKKKLHIQIKPQHLIASWLAPPLKLQYDRKTKQLLKYTGVSSIPRNINHHYRVHINLNYNHKNNLFLTLYKIVYKKDYVNT